MCAMLETAERFLNGRAGEGEHEPWLATRTPDAGPEDGAPEDDIEDGDDVVEELDDELYVDLEDDRDADPDDVCDADELKR